MSARVPNLIRYKTKLVNSFFRCHDIFEMANRWCRSETRESSMKFFLVMIFFLNAKALLAEEKLQMKKILTEIPTSTKFVFKKSFSREALPYWGAIVGSSALLFRYDEQILAETQRKGRDWRIGNEDNTKPVITIGGQELLRLPTDTGSFMYFLGDGWMHAAIGGGFVASGQLKDNDYNFNTGLMLWHGMITSTIFNQIIKRSWGRESPEVKTHERGNTKPFPSVGEYNKRTGSYDAMPSGHVMTATLTFTILSERYPEYNCYIYPVAGVWVSALMFEMVNNGVHWASDYPLGIAMGYIFGKAATTMVNNSKSSEKKDPLETSWQVMPGPSGLYAWKRF